jgi:hypothetical protein
LQNDMLPRNGEVNREFGIYQNLCCGAEIVIPENVTFPDCVVHNNLVIHNNLPIEWKNITKMDRIPHASQLNPRRKDKPAA